MMVVFYNVHAALFFLTLGATECVIIVHSYKKTHNTTTSILYSSPQSEEGQFETSLDHQQLMIYKFQ